VNTTLSGKPYLTKSDIYYRILFVKDSKKAIAVGIPEEQLETWSHQGATTTAKLTHETVRNAFSHTSSPLEGKDIEVYLQGSYVNDTNIRTESDVDIVVQLNSSWFPDTSRLPPEQQQLYNSSYSTATYTDQHFRYDVIRSLQSYFGTSSIHVGNKSIKVLPGSGRLSADVVAGLQYRRYLFFRGIYDQDFVAGIGFHSQDGELIVHFPKLHYENGVRKNASTQNWFKPTVRLFKNTRSYMVDHNLIGADLAPSYFLECMIYNVPDSEFGPSFSDTFCNIVNWLAKQDINGFVCQSEQSMLFGTSSEQWSIDKARRFVNATINLWNNWR
jgi:hypothetical protein